MRQLVKPCLFAFGCVLSSPLIILSWIEAVVFGKKVERIFAACTEVLSQVPTPIGTNMRRAFYFAACTDVSWEATFGLGSWLAHRDNQLGRGVTIGAYTYIGYAVVGDGVLFSARNSIVSGKYQHGRPSERSCNGPIVKANEVLHIGKNSWIGQDAILMANVGENCTIGAGSVVTRDVPDGTTVMGNPARRISLSTEC